MVALFVCGNYAIYSAFAEEPAEPVNEQTAETETETEVKDLKAQVAEIVAAYNTWKDDNYFANNILPILLGVGSTLIGLRKHLHFLLHRGGTERLAFAHVIQMLFLILLHGIPPDDVLHPVWWS